jgi:hypothetical protein
MKSKERFDELHRSMNLPNLHINITPRRNSQYDKIYIQSFTNPFLDYQPRNNRQ